MAAEASTRAAIIVLREAMATWASSGLAPDEFVLWRNRALERVWEDQVAVGKVRRSWRTAGPPRAMRRVMVLIAAQRIIASEVAVWRS